MPTRYAIVGAGMMGAEHMRNIALLPDCAVTAVVEPDDAMRAAALTEAERLFGAPPRVAEGVDDLGDVDAVVVAAPNHTHAAILARLLPTDLPVLCEKPLGVSTNEALALLEAGRGRRAPVWVAMEYRYMPPIARLVAAVRDEEQGPLATLAIREHRFPFLAKVGDWNRFNRMTGGTLVEKCCHFFDLMRLIVGTEPTRIYASGGAAVNHLDELYAQEDGRFLAPDILDHAFVVVDFEGGRRASLDLCMFAEGSRWQEIVTATCARGQLAALVPGPARFDPEGIAREAEFRTTERTSKFERREPMPVPPDVLAAGDHHGSTFEQHRRFLRCVREGAVPEVGLREGAIAVAVGTAAEESVRSGQAIDLRARLEAFA